MCIYKDVYAHPWAWYCVFLKKKKETPPEDIDRPGRTKYVHDELSYEYEYRG